MGSRVLLERGLQGTHRASGVLEVSSGGGYALLGTGGEELQGLQEEEWVSGGSERTGEVDDFIVGNYADFIGRTRDWAIMGNGHYTCLFISGHLRWEDKELEVYSFKVICPYRSSADNELDDPICRDAIYFYAQVNFLYNNIVE